MADLERTIQQQRDEIARLTAQVGNLKDKVQALEDEPVSSNALLDDLVSQRNKEIARLTEKYEMWHKEAVRSAGQLSEYQRMHETLMEAQNAEIARLRAALEAQSPFEMVREFHRVYGVPVLDAPAIPTPDRVELRHAILFEEFEEYSAAMRAESLIETADALADMMYVICGTALEYGIPLDAVFAEVHHSNMSKLGEDGKPIRRADGKVLKGPNYFKPDIHSAIDRARGQQ